MSSIQIATLTDIPRLGELLALLFTQEAEFRPNRVRQVAGLRLIIERPEAGRILVAREGSIIVGMVNILFTVSTALGGRVALLEDLVVEPKYRGVGIGSNLLQSAMHLAKEVGCLRITLLTDSVNLSAIDFYQRHGFRRSEMIPLRFLLDKV